MKMKSVRWSWRFLWKFGVPAAVLALSLAATFFTWRISRLNSERQLVEKFQSQIREIAFLIQKRVDLYNSTLYSTQALFAASPGGVDRRAWTAFSQTENLKERFPGLTAIRYIERVTPEDKEAFTQAVRTDTSVLPSGYPYFQILPAGDRPEYYAVKYVHPPKGNESMLGVDVGADRATRAAFDVARDGGRPAATAPIGSSDGDPVILLVHPIYGSDTIPSTRDERRAALVGFVDIVLKVKELLYNALQAGISRHVRFEIFDGRAEAESLLYDSHAQQAPAALGRAQFSEIFPMEVAGRVWLLRFTALKGYESASDRKLSWSILVGGFVSSVLLAGILYAFATSQSRADRLAKKMTQDLSREVSERKFAEEKLQIFVRDLERRNREASLLSQLAQLLQSCSRLDEAYQMTGKFAIEMFPGTKGALYCFNPTRAFLEAVAEWGAALPGEKVFGPDDCWALKQGKPHAAKPGSAELPCRHVKPVPASGYVCVPLLAHGEALGILHLQALVPSAEASEPVEHQRELATSVAEQVALTLANLKLREALRAQSIRDKVTGLYNRHYMEESLERELVRVTRQKEPLGLIMLDLDHFKKINDTYGHDAGDSVLAAMGKYLITRFRGSDIPCRFGGEEFIVILPSAPLEKTLSIAEELRAAAKDIRVSAAAAPISVSVGVAVFPEHGGNGETLLRAADMALYQAKHEGRDRVRSAGGPLP